MILGENAIGCLYINGILFLFMEAFASEHACNTLPMIGASSYSENLSISNIFHGYSFSREMFRLNLESKVAKKLYGHHRNIDDENYQQLAMGKYVIHPMSDFRFVLVT